MQSMKPLSLVVTDISAETEHFDHARSHAHADVHRGYCISFPLLHKDGVTLRIMGVNREKQSFILA